MGDWRSRQECLCAFAATTDRVFACDLVAGDGIDDAAPLFPVPGAAGASRNRCRAAVPGGDLIRPSRLVRVSGGQGTLIYRGLGISHLPIRE